MIILVICVLSWLYQFCYSKEKRSNELKAQECDARPNGSSGRATADATSTAAGPKNS